MIEGSGFSNTPIDYSNIGADGKALSASLLTTSDNSKEILPSVAISRS